MFVFPYCYIWTHWSLYRFPSEYCNWGTLLLGIFGVDFFYYWFHRMAHEWAIGWAGHHVHHSSEDYNLTTAVRQGLLQAIVSPWFMMPLAFVFPPRIFYFWRQVNTIYQFYIHTELIRSMGFLETFLNTPSHHRVHHGRQPYCINVNYGGVFIIFDKMFGTFAAEEERVIYGLVHPLISWSPMEQFGYARYMLSNMMATPGSPLRKLSVLFRDPGWVDGEILPIPEVTEFQLYNRSTSWVLSIYSILALLLSIIFFYFTHICNWYGLTLAGKIGAAFFDILSLFSLAAIFDRRSFAIPLELLRLITTGLIIALIVHAIPSQPLVMTLWGWYGIMTTLFLLGMWNGTDNLKDEVAWPIMVKGWHGEEACAKMELAQLEHKPKVE